MTLGPRVTFGARLIGGAAGGPSTSAQDATIAVRSAIGGPQWARTEGHCGDGSLWRAVGPNKTTPPHLRHSMLRCGPLAAVAYTPQKPRPG
eukprot:2092393-Pyramimonas_sp.AAC.1